MARVKYSNSDFIVHEVSLFPANLSAGAFGNKNIAIARLKKEGYTSFESLHKIAEFFSLPFSEVRCQGLKDEDGITTQLISINKILTNKELSDFNEDNHNLSKGYIELELVGYSVTPVREKCLHGNIFTVKIRDLSDEELQRITHRLYTGKNFTYLNYYDSQRFGLPGGPYLTHKTGEAIVDNNLKLAFENYVLSGNAKNDTLENVFANRSIDPRQVQFFIESYYSYVWNNTLASMIKGSQFITIFDGYKLPICDMQTLISPVLSCKSKRLNKEWAFTDDVKTRETVITTSIYILSSGADERNNNKNYMELTFMLPTGSYATLMLKQLLASCNINDIIIGGL
jgi:tRNA pseudouridine13 synthase